MAFMCNESVKIWGEAMLGTGLARLVICRHAEDTAAKPREYHARTMAVGVAANASGHIGEASEPAAVAIPGTVPAPIYLSVRELEIVARIAAGATSMEIAEQLHISVHTVKNHRKNILHKAGCRNSGQLINRCMALGLV